MARILLSPPSTGDAERRMLLDALSSNWVAPVGPDLDAFEQELAVCLGGVSVAALSSGTAALHLALLILGVGPGDEVLIPTLTFVATANAVRYCGAEPVFVDVDRDTWQVDPGLVVAAIEDGARAGRPPRAVITVDLYGQCADHDPIREACERFSVALIEDAAEALGATYRGRQAGTLGDLGVLSFNGNKIITTSGGGALVSDDPTRIARARFLATQARDPAPHYQHSTVGYNYRLSNLLAAVGRAQLSTLDERVAARRRTNARYRAALSNIDGVAFMPEAPYGCATSWLTALTIDAERFGAHREDVRHHLERCDIEARPVWKPLHLQPAFAGCSRIGGGVAETLFDAGLCLPSGSDLTDEECDRVVAGICAARR